MSALVNGPWARSCKNKQCTGGVSRQRFTWRSQTWPSGSVARRCRTRIWSIRASNRDWNFGKYMTLARERNPDPQTSTDAKNVTLCSPRQVKLEENHYKLSSVSYDKQKKWRNRWKRYSLSSEIPSSTELRPERKAIETLCRYLKLTCHHSFERRRFQPQ